MRRCAGYVWSLFWMTAGLAAVIGGCAHKAATSTAAPVISAPITGSNLSGADLGRSIYSGKCASCHSAPSISSYTIDQWTGSIIPSMSAKAGLTSTETQALTTYITSVKNNSS